MLRFQHDVVRTLADALGAHPDYFTDLLEDGPVVNRATWYPPMAEAPTDRHVWAVEHQDFDLITMLPRATSAGLEVLVDGEWLKVEAPPGHAVVNVGMVLDRLTNGLARAAVHRVVAPPDSGKGGCPSCSSATRRPGPPSPRCASPARRRARSASPP